MSSHNLGTSWNEKTRWLMISHDIIATLQTTNLLRKGFKKTQAYFGENEFLVTQKPQLTKINFKEAYQRVMALKDESESKMKAYLKERGDMLSYLDYEE